MVAGIKKNVLLKEPPVLFKTEFIPKILASMQRSDDGIRMANKIHDPGMEMLQQPVDKEISANFLETQNIALVPYRFHEGRTHFLQGAEKMVAQKPAVLILFGENPGQQSRQQRTRLRVRSITVADFRSKRTSLGVQRLEQEQAA